MKNQNRNWWMGVALYTGFLVTFFLDATGVELHQWIGLFIGFLALVHLVHHIDWVTMVTAKFFGDISNSARVNLILDAGLGLGFFSIIFTGIVMSTWLNLTIIDFAAWSNIHTLLSVVTLFALLLKIILHRKWIVCTAEKYIFKRTPKKALEPVIAIQPTATRVNRREFLKVSAVVGAGTIIGVTHIHKVFEDIISENTAIGSTQAGGGLASAVNGDTTAQLQQNIPTVATQPAALPETQAIAVPTAQPTVIPTAAVVNSQPAAACQVQCRKGCSYPGRCRRYTDANNNGKCDLGECV